LTACIVPTGKQGTLTTFPSIMQIQDELGDIENYQNRKKNQIDRTR